MLYRDNGKGNGNYHVIMGYILGYIGVILGTIASPNKAALDL